MRLLVSGLVFVVASAPLAAEYAIVRRTTLDGGAQEQTEYWGRKRVVLDDPAQRTIVDFGAETLTVVDKADRSYVVVRLEDIRRELLVVGAIFEALPPAAREVLGVGRRLTLAATANETTIAGRRAREYGVGGDNVTGWVWFAEDLDPAAIVGEEATAWWRAGGPLRAVGPLGDLAQAIADARVRGMPVWVWLTAGSKDGTSTITSEVHAIREETAPADVVRIPEGFRKRALLSEE